MADGPATRTAGERRAYLDRARGALRAADPVIARLIDTHPDFDPDAWLASLPAMDPFGVLLFQVAGQQLSVRATRTILARIEEHFGAVPGVGRWTAHGFLVLALGRDDVVATGDLALRKAA